MYKRPDPPMLPLPASHHDVVGCYWRANDAFIDELSAELAGRRVLEVFAGNGYLAGLLSSRGIDVVATSILSSMDAHERGLYHPIVELDAVAAVKALHGDRDVLLMCWPTVTEQAVEAALWWHELRGGPIAYVGEFTDYAKGHLGGCASDAFFEVFQAEKVFPSYQGNEMERACLGRLKPPKPAAAKRPSMSFRT